MRLSLLFFVLPTLAIGQVEQGAPNAGFDPAFPEQTRAPALETTPVTTTILADGLQRPWGIAALPDGAFVVTERPGRMRLIDADGVLSDPITGLPDVWDQGQGGLLDVAASPNFATDRTLFWTYAKPVDGGAVTAAARGILGDNNALTDVRDIFVQSNPTSKGQHFGSRVIPMSDGTVWVTTGDRGAGDDGTLVQDITTTHGKVIRVTDTGGVLTSNPFVNQLGDDAVWSYGHRNMQGATIGPDGALYTIEHGPRGGDELNKPVAGGNYGWPLVSYGINYRGSDVGEGVAVQDGTEQPVYYWDPVIAPGGMSFYDGPYSDWQDDLLIGSLNPGALVRLKMTDGLVTGEERLLTDVGRVRDVEVTADGRVFVLIDDTDGAVLEVVVGE
ncbi:PQQ-dependent sugar dehydrogenase [Rhodobacteraceae bacterium S2214]|nr:PQQ-dependent sugar dehydrogenase [Rhodobacteraceae bacterium S2214]